MDARYQLRHSPVGASTVAARNRCLTPFVGSRSWTNARRSSELGQSARSPFSNTGNVPKGYVGEVDAFGVYSPELHETFLVPLEHTSARNCSLRLVPPANGQRRGIRYAADYGLRRPR